ncbi:MAG: hypothetical protein V3V08_14810 [Nannocystaceae bacterium]
MTILWPAVIAAVMPLGLGELVERLPSIADFLDRDHPSCKPQQVPLLRLEMGDTWTRS